MCTLWPVASEDFVELHWTPAIASCLCGGIKCTLVTFAMSCFTSTLSSPHENFILRLRIKVQSNVSPPQLSRLIPCSESKMERQSPPNGSLENFRTVLAEMALVKQQILLGFSQRSCCLWTVSLCKHLYQLFLSGQKDFSGFVEFRISDYVCCWIRISQLALNTTL